MGRYLAQYCEIDLQQVLMSVRLFSKVIIFNQLEISFSLGNLIIVKTYVHFAVIVSQSARVINSVFKNLIYLYREIM